MYNSFLIHNSAFGLVKLSKGKQIILNERNSYVTEFLKNFF